MRHMLWMAGVGHAKGMVFRSLPKTPNETPTLLIKIAKEISAPSDVL